MAKWCATNLGRVRARISKSDFKIEPWRSRLPYPFPSVSGSSAHYFEVTVSFSVSDSIGMGSNNASGRQRYGLPKKRQVDDTGVSINDRGQRQKLLVSCSETPARWIKDAWGFECCPPWEIGNPWYRSVLLNLYYIMNLIFAEFERMINLGAKLDLVGVPVGFWPRMHW